MKVSGLLALKIPVQEYEYSSRWFKKILDYSRVFGDFFYEGEYSTEKLTFVLSPQGGLPVVLSQQLYSRVHGYDRPTLANLGVLAFKVRTGDIKKHYLKLKAAKEPFVEKLANTYFDKYCFWVTDNDANLYQVVEDKGPEGLYSVLINVDDIHQAIDFFSALGFKEYHSSHGYFTDLEPLGFARGMKAKRVILRCEEEHALSQYTGPTEIDLVQLIDNQKRGVFTKYTLYFTATQTYKRPEAFTPQFRVIDNDHLLAVYSPIDYKLAKIRVIEVRTLKFKDFVEIDLTRYTNESLSKRKLSVLLNNVVEKLD